MTLLYTLSVELLLVILCLLGKLRLSPMTVAPVCHVGGPLQLTCTTSVQFIKWSVLQFNEQGTPEEAANSVQINARDANQMTTRQVNSATFTFMRSSARNNIPLISILFIDSVSIGLHGTEIHCSDVTDPRTLSSTTIQITNISQISKLASHLCT